MPERKLSVVMRARARRRKPRRAAAGVQPLLAKVRSQNEELHAQNEQLRASRRELETARRRYINLYDFAPFGCLSLDARGFILELNLRAAAMLGANRSNLVGKRLQSYIWKGDFENFRAHLLRAKRSRESVRAELRLDAGGGRTIWVQMVTAVAEDPGRRMKVLTCSIADITERQRAEQELAASRPFEAALRESEARLQAILDISSAAIFMKDTEGRYLSVNRQFETVYAVSRTQVIGRTDHELFEPERAALTRVNDLRVLESDAPLETEEPVLRNGVLQTSLVHRFPVRDTKGNIYAIFGSAMDQKPWNASKGKPGRDARLENSLALQLIEVQEAERRHIARELHDQVGQVLTALKLSLRINPDGRSGKIRADLKRAEALVSDLTTRVRDLSLTLRPSLLDDLGLLPALVWHFDRYTEQTRIRVTFKHSGVEGKRFRPETETAAYRIVQESLTNVARHAGVNEVIVRVWSDPEHLHIQVEDHGKGFDPEKAFLGTESRGLIGMRERANLLGGKFTIDAACGAGTCLTAALVIGKDDEKDIHESDHCSG